MAPQRVATPLLNVILIFVCFAYSNPFKNCNINPKITLPFSYSLTGSLCLLLLLLRHLLKSKVLFLRRFGGPEKHLRFGQPDTVEKCWTVVCEIVKVNNYFE